jgi:hypothetical protein
VEGELEGGRFSTCMRAAVPALSHVRPTVVSPFDHLPSITNVSPCVVDTPPPASSVNGAAEGAV